MALSLITSHSTWGNVAKLSVDWNSPKRISREFHCNRSFPGSAVSQWSMEKRRKQKFIERGRWSYGFLSGRVVVFCASSDADLIYSIRRSESSCRKSWPWQYTPGILVFWRLTKKNLGVYDQAGPLQRFCLKCKKEKRREGGRRRRKKWRKEERKTYNILTLINIEDPFGETQMCSAIKQQIEKCFLAFYKCRDISSICLFEYGCCFLTIPKYIHIDLWNKTMFGVHKNVDESKVLGLADPQERDQRNLLF